MKIVDSKLIDIEDGKSVKFIRVEPENIAITLRDVLNALSNLSWIAQFDQEYIRSSYEVRAQATVDYKYFEATNDIRADKLAKYVKYGTDDNKKIWMLRYGLSFEDIEVLEKYVLKIDKEEMVLSRDVLNLPEDKIFSIQRFLPQE